MWRVIVVAGALFQWFRNWRQERIVKQFFSLLEQKKYQDAYAMWVHAGPPLQILFSRSVYRRLGTVQSIFERRGHQDPA